MKFKGFSMNNIYLSKDQSTNEQIWIWIEKYIVKNRKLKLFRNWRFLAPQSMKYMIPCSHENAAFDENLNHKNEGYDYNYNSLYDSGSDQTKY